MVGLNKKDVYYKFREEWLMRAIPALEERITVMGGPSVPTVRVTVSWPATGARGKAIGECYAPQVSADGVIQITISPKLDEEVEVLAVLLHELIHAAVGVKVGHKGPFKRVALDVGLEGKMTATVPSTALRGDLAALAKRLGPFPHSRMSLAERERKKQGTRLLKVECPDCGYTCRVTSKWIDVGLPTCPCGQVMVAEDADGE